MLGKTENRQVWIDFPYPKEIFLALHFDRFCLEIKKKDNTCFSEGLVHSWFDYLCVNSTKRRYSENQYREITTANWGLATTNQPILQSGKRLSVGLLH